MGERSEPNLQYQVENPVDILAFYERNRQSMYEGVSPDVLRRAIEVANLFLSDNGRFKKSEYDAAVVEKVKTALDSFEKELQRRNQLRGV